MIGSTFARRLDQLGAEHQKLVAAALVEIVVFQKHRRRQHDVGHRSRFGHEMLVNADEQVVAREAALHLALRGRHDDRVGALHQQRLDRAAATQGFGLAAQNRADPRLIEHAGVGVAGVEALDQRFPPMIDRRIVVEGPAALMGPGAGDGGDAGGGVHVRRAVALARKAVAEAEIAALALTDQRRERLDFLNLQPGDGARPSRIAGSQMSNT